MDLRGTSFEWIAALPLVTLLAAGCCTPGTGQTSGINKEREKDAMDRASKALDKPDDNSGNKLTARSQSPPDQPAPLAAPAQPAPQVIQPVVNEEFKADLQVRVVARFGEAAVYDREVKEVVAQRAGEFYQLVGDARRTKEKQIYWEELKKLIDRELIIDELMVKLKKAKNDKAQQEIKKVAKEEADKKLKEYRKNRKIDTEEEFVKLLDLQGISLAGLRRQIERDFIKNIYLQELMKPKKELISIADIHDYYDKHSDEFKVEESVKWNDMFISKSIFDNSKPGEARKYAMAILEHVKAGEDFAKLGEQYDKGDSKFRKSMGAGEKRGEIRPPECEETLFALKPNESKLIETDNGFHIVKVVERVYPGLRPFNDKLQAEIRRKLTNQILDSEYQRITDALWRQAQPQILIDP